MSDNMNFKLFLIPLILFSCKDNTSKDHAPYTTSSEVEIPNNTAHKISSAPKIDGQLDEEIWQAVPKSTRFRDLISGAETIHDTRAAVVWDEEFLYVAYWIEEPILQATLT